MVRVSEDGVKSKPEGSGQQESLQLPNHDLVTLRLELRRLTQEVSGLRHDLKAALAPKWKTKPFYTVKELAKHLGRSTYTIRRWIRDGKLQAVKLNSGGPRDPYLIEHREVQELLTQAETRDHVLVSR
jgi:excisionase family DNA binding protein